MYKFTLQIDDGDETNVNPVYGEGDMFTASIQSIDSGEFLNKKLATSLELQRGEAQLIVDADFDSEFTLKTYLPKSDQLVWEGKFYKTDCDFYKTQTSYRVVIKEARTVDTYTNILKNINKEYDIITELATPFREISYKRRSVVQIYMHGSGKINNFLGKNIYFQNDVDDKDISLNDVQLYGFEDNGFFAYITGVGTNDIQQDVCGFYTPFYVLVGGIPQLTRFEKGDYYILNTPDNMVVREKIGVTPSGSDPIIYQGGTGSRLTTPHLPAEPLDHISDGTQVRFYAFSFFARLLTDTTEIGGNPTTPILDNDFAGGSGGYLYTYPVETDNIIISEENNDTTGKLSRFPSDAIHFPNNYFLTPVSSDILYPVNESDWYDVATFLSWDSSIADLLDQGDKTVILKHAYSLTNVIKAFLSAIDPNLTFESSPEYSSFLFESNNIRPVVREIFITPNSNIKVGEYDEPATIAKLIFNSLLKFLKDVYRVRWFVDAENRFRIEHINWFDDIDNNETIDISALKEPSSKVLWDYGNEQFSYEKQELPQTLQYKWSYKVSEAFAGLPIEHLGRFVSDEVQDITFENFSSDIDYILLQPDSIDDVGFMVFECDIDNDNRTVPVVDIVFKGNTFSLQNGYLSLAYIAENYFIYDAASSNLNINGNAVTSNSEMKSKVKNVIFASKDHVLSNILYLQTADGVGKVVEYSQSDCDMNENVIIKAKIKLDV